jgi:Leucine-rich repeat (LRR) protein
LEELSLESNTLTAVSGLGSLTNLAKLDLGKNRLGVLEVQTVFKGLETCLTQLSLEDNLLRSLAGFEVLTNLMELYLGNNQLDSLKELAYLKDLPRLLILDMSGNPMSQLAEYRLYAIYNMKKLKVLDGVAIEAGELNAAREQYSGRLTEDLLAEILGHTFFKHIENLDLNSAKIRNMEVISAERFCNLRVLVLDNKSVADGRAIDGCRAAFH